MMDLFVGKSWVDVLITLIAAIQLPYKIQEYFFWELETRRITNLEI